MQMPNKKRAKRQRERECCAVQKYTPFMQMPQKTKGEKPREREEEHAVLSKRRKGRPKKYCQK
jgi:hypothetical protein